MSKDQPKSGARLTRWFLKRLFSLPSTWIGILAGGAIANAAYNVKMPLSGAIGAGTVFGIFIGLVTYGLFAGVKAAYRKAEAESDDGDNIREDRVIENLVRLGLDTEVKMLKGMIEDREAVELRGKGGDESADRIHTLNLVTAIIEASIMQGEELADLVRRRDDPVLDAPEDVDVRIKQIGEDLKAAYQAVADARSRFRRGDALKEADFLDSDQKGVGLTELTAQLREETEISRRVLERLQEGIESRIVEDDSSATGDTGGGVYERD